MNNKNQKGLYAGLLAAGLALGVLAANLNTGGKTPEQETADTPTPAAPEKTPESEDTAPAQETETASRTAKIAESGTGIVVVKADEYQEKYPNQYLSYMKNSENSDVIEYTEEYPYIKTLYEGYGFAKSYGSARGHTYVIDDISATGRPHKLANCYTCKTSSFTAAVLNEGDSAYAGAFEDFTSQITDPFGCFHCHGNDVGSGVITVTHGYLVNALGDDFDTVDMANLSCGQCHTEYYFDPATKATSLGYHSLATMNPDDMIAYENTLVDGEGNLFADWVDEDTGVRKLKVQHPEFETVLGAGSPHGTPDSMLTLTCADCHMGTAKAEDGTVYTNHYWTSPLDNPELLESNCSRCHKDLAAEVEGMQKKTIDRLNELGNAYAQLDADLAKAIADGKIEGENLENIRMMFRNGQWYWDFVFVENSDGVHNPKLTTHCLDMAEQYLKDAQELLK